MKMIGVLALSSVLLVLSACMSVEGLEGIDPTLSAAVQRYEESETARVVAQRNYDEALAIAEAGIRQGEQRIEALDQQFGHVLSLGMIFIGLVMVAFVIVIVGILLFGKRELQANIDYLKRVKLPEQQAKIQIVLKDLRKLQEMRERRYVVQTNVRPPATPRSAPPVSPPAYSRGEASHETTAPYPDVPHQRSSVDQTRRMARFDGGETRPPTMPEEL